MVKDQPGFSSLPQEEHNLFQNDLIVKRAKGSYVWMEDDPEPYLDLMMAYSSTNFGHLNDDILKTFSDVSADNVAFFSSRAHEDLIQRLGRALGLDGEWSFYFEVGGAMAVETATRACLLAKPGGLLMSLNGAFHGYSAAARALTDKAFLRTDAFMAAAECIKSPRPIDAGSVEAALEAFESNLKTHSISGVILEPVQGAAGWIDLGTEFLQGVRHMCTKYEVPLIFDEIQCGLFRCGSMTVGLERSVVPDIMLLSKSLGGGIAPISAIIIKGELIKKLPRDHAGFDSTFSAWTVGVNAVLRVLDLIEKNDFAGVVSEKGKLIDQILDNELRDSPIRSRIRRVGLGVVYDGQSAVEATRVRLAALDRHVIIHTAGTDGTKCKISPAFTITNDDLTKGSRIFAEALRLHGEGEMRVA